ncbi:F-box/kelch-repeat protein At3g23880-like [Silene latifolia]|uniref:F-box/kelch-repeat protein At3g23880-like n=1 Tax=Silene latifolia TaxID=37657 RepID=UPI003D7851A6
MEDKVVNSKKRKVIEQQSYFFDALIIENILLKLPVKSILRFKSVSKQWHSILSSSNFINAHFMKSPFSHPSAPVNTLFILSNNKYYLYSYDDDDQISGNFNNNLVRVDLELGVKKVYTRLAGCCNGLICLTPEHGNYFIIWNPATSKMHKYESDDYLGDLYVSGFGHVSSVDDYKYVRISTLKANIIVQEDIIVHIFSRRENKWRKINFYHQDAKMPLYFFGQAVLINETLYWYAHGCGHLAYIVSFDIGVEKFDILMKASGSIIGLMGGCLSIYNFSRRFTGNRLKHIVPKSGTSSCNCETYYCNKEAEDRRVLSNDWVYED